MEHHEELAGTHASVAPNADVISAAPTASAGAKRFWKSLEEVDSATWGESYDDFVRREYPSQADKLQDPPQRRDFLKLMGSSLALAGVTAACTRQPKETIYAYARNPEITLPGKALYFASTMPWASGGLGVVVESHEGRPTKIEGNELHPASLGSTDLMTQATVLGLYDTQRSQNITRRGAIQTWSDVTTMLKASLGEMASVQGSGLRILTGSVVSPTLEAQIADVLKAYPRARWVQWEPVNRDNARRGATTAFGRDVEMLPDFEKADVVLSLESDFLAGPGGVLATKQFTKRRRVRSGGVVEMNRLYTVESAPSITGASSDHRLAIRSQDVDLFARKVAMELGVAGVPSPSGGNAQIERFAKAVAKDLNAHNGAALVVAGASQPPHVHALAHAMNAKLGAFGKTCTFTAPVEAQSPGTNGHLEGLQQLVADMKAGAVKLLVILDANPSYTAPADLAFGEALKRVEQKLHLGLYQDETAMDCDWHVNAAHFLESWSDARATDGTRSLVQPLIAPLYGGKTPHEVVAALLDKAAMSSYDIVREHWQQELTNDFEHAWRRALHDGVVPGTKAATVNVESQALQLPALASLQGLELTFAPDPSIHDGRFALNSWLQEIPKPLTKLTWENVVQLSPATATRLGVKSGDVVELDHGGRKVSGPVWVQPGQADESAQIHLGFGRKYAGSFATNLGFDAYALRTSAALWAASNVGVRATGDSVKLASTQGHDRLDVTPEGIVIADRTRDVYRAGTIDRFRQSPEHFDAPPAEGHGNAHGEAQHPEGAHGEHDTSIYPKHPRGDYAWGMVIDLNTCTGCNACVVACQSENNVPVVGKKEILRGREMHWIRIDRYFEGDRERPRIRMQPLPCMHCENAPCETVCPVEATSHGPEGLNEMTYNRCVGTRYCANNCPYKVRRFNFFLYADYGTPSLKLGRNPDVTVRSRGVMEKCTYCVQRINRARLAAKREDRRVRDGEIVPACQQVCPADAIVFGDVDDPTTRVAALKKQPHNYAMLAELNTIPRTTYLGRVSNPNPELEPSI